MSSEHSHIKIAYSAIRVFADDGTLDLEELNFLMGLALQDGIIDDEEKRVLGNIFNQLSQADVSAKVWERMMQIRAKYGIR